MWDEHVPLVHNPSKANYKERESFYDDYRSFSNPWTTWVWPQIKDVLQRMASRHGIRLINKAKLGMMNLGL